MSELTPSVDVLHGGLVKLIATSRQRVATAVNAELTMLYWSIGQRLSLEVLDGDRAAYGAKMIEQIASRLTEEFGRGFERETSDA